jgi:hypothetical protein
MDETFKQWMKEVDMEHLSTWMECVGTSTLESDMTAQERRHLAASLDLPPQFGGVGLQSLVRAADEELLGSWASVTGNLIAFFRSKGLTVYDKLADALDTMADENINMAIHIIPAFASLLTVSTKAYAFLEDIKQAEMDFATATVFGEILVEISGRFAPLEAAEKPEPMVLPELRVPGEYATATCKHECAIMKQSRHVRQAHAVWAEDTTIQRSLMLSRAGQCGITTTKATLAEVHVVATMDKPEKFSHIDLSESLLYSASTLHLYGLFFDYDALRSVKPPDACPACSIALT